MSPVMFAAASVFLAVVALGGALLAIRVRERRFRRAHAELGEIKRRLHDGLTQSSMSMFTVARDGTIRSFEGRRVPNTRLSMTTCVGLPAHDLLAAWPDWWTATLAAQRGNASTLLVTVDDACLEVHCGPLRDDDAQLTGAIVTVRDNTEGQRDHERAQRLAEVRSTALATINHKLRGHLNGMLGVTDLLRTEPLTEQARDWLDLTATSGDRLLAFLRHLVELMELEAHRGDLDAEPFSLREQLDEVVSAQRTRAEAEQTTLALRYPLALSEHFIGDLHRVRETIELLVDVTLGTNAGGEVLVNVEERRTDVDESVMVVSVEDRGRGLSAQALERIFDGLDSPSAMWARRSGGTGLELAVAKLAAGALGGDLQVESAAGVGTTLCLELPLERTAVVYPPAAEDLSTHATSAGASGLRVLLVDDSLEQQQVASSMLERLLHRVTVVGNGAEALEALDRGPFDLVLTELHMPVTDGFEATAAIRGRADALATLPIVALTSDTRPQLRARARESGMDDFLEKPLSLDRLERCLAAVGQTRRPAEAAPDTEDAVHEVIDRDAIARLRALDPSGEAELLGDILQAFQSATPRQLLQLRDAALAMDTEQLEPLLRSVTKSCRLLGARRMERACTRLQRAVEEGDLAATRSGVDALMAEFSLLRRSLPAVSQPPAVA